MSESKRSIPTGVALLALLLFTTQAFAAAPRITATSHAESSHELTPAEHRAASLAAGRILRHAYLARQAVAEEDGKKAAAEVDQGLKLVRIIESAQPKWTVTAEIKAGDLSYSADEVVAAPLVPIYDELGEVELLGPVAAAKQEQQSGREEVVQDVSVEHTALSLNLAFAKAGLTQAKKALGDKDLERADGALAFVQRSTVFEVDELDLPLATVRENLFLAKTRVGSGDSDGAREALNTASEALDGYAKTAGGERSKEVEQLQGEISKLSKDLASGEGGAAASGDVEEKILSWWDRVVQWWEE
jgi:hypothetical protein